MVINSLPDNTFLDWSKLKHNADNILKCIKNENGVPYMVEKQSEKGRNSLLQAISSFLTMFSTAIYLYWLRKNVALCDNRRMENALNGFYMSAIQTF